MEDDSYDEESQSSPRQSPPSRRSVGDLARAAGAWVTDTARATAERGENMKDWANKKIDKMNVWAARNKVCIAVSVTFFLFSPSAPPPASLYLLTLIYAHLHHVQIGRYFRFKERRAKLSTEMRGGVITFFMVAYALAVNPQILGVTGGTCDAATLCDPDEYRIQGHACLFDSENEAAVNCLSTLKMSLTTATAATSLIACFISGYFANLPVALAPGMGINIYVAYQVVAQGLLTFQQAMVAIFIEGWLFIFLSMTGIRGGIIRLMPKNIAFASSVGIGLLLAFSGLRNLGIIVFDANTLVTVGGCPIENRRYVLTFDAANSMFNASSTSASTSAPPGSSAANFTNITLNDGIVESSPTVYTCAGGEMKSATMWLGIAGGFLMAFLAASSVRGALFIGIVFVTVISWIPGHGASYLGADSSTPGGAQRLDVFEQVVAAPSLEGIGLAWDWSAVSSGHFWVAMFTFLYIDLLDCTGTLLSMATLLDDCMERDAEEEGKLDEYVPFLNDEKEFSGQQWAFLADGCGIVAGSMMGTTPLTVYIESAAGIEDGARTGLSAIVVAFFFFIALFFSPILASIPPYATGPALILVGVMLIAHVDRIDWNNELESVPAFLTLIVMPFTLSVAYGIIAGIISYIALHLPGWAWRTSRMQLAAWKKRRRLARGESGDEDGDGGDGRNGFGGGPPSSVSGGNGPIYQLSPSPSHRRRKVVHRKVFADGTATRQSSMHTEAFGSIPNDLAYLEVVDPTTWAVRTAGGGAHGGLRRSTSQGSFRGMSAAAAGAAAAAAAGGGYHHHHHQGGPNRGGGVGNGNGVGGRYYYNNNQGGQQRLVSSWEGGGVGVGGTAAGGIYPNQRGLTRAASISGAGARGAIPMGITSAGFPPSRGMARSRTFSNGTTDRFNVSYASSSQGHGLDYLAQSSDSPPSNHQLFPLDPGISGMSGLPSGEPTFGVGGVSLASGVSSFSGTGANSPVGDGGGGGSSGFLFGGQLMNLNLDGDGGGGDGDGDRDDSGGLLFGGQLLDLNLDGDEDGGGGDKEEVVVEKTERGGQLEASLTPPPPPDDNGDGNDGGNEQEEEEEENEEVGELMENRTSLVLSSGGGSDLSTLPSVDLTAFRLGRPSVSSADTSTAGDGGGGGGVGGEASTTLDPGGDNEEGIVTLTSSTLSQGVGSISFQKMSEDVVKERSVGIEAAAAAAVAAVAAKEKEEEKAAKRVGIVEKPTEMELGSRPPIPTDNDNGESSNTSRQVSAPLPSSGLSSTSPPTHQRPALKRIESAAAIRLRNLFSADDDDEDGDGGDSARNGVTSATPSASNGRKVTRVLSAPSRSPFDRAISPLASPRAQSPRPR